MGEEKKAGAQAQLVDGFKRGELLLQHCKFSGEYFFYPRVAAAGIRPGEWELTPACGNGHVYAAAYINLKGDDSAAFCVGLVDLVEGPRIMARIINAKNPPPVPGTSVRLKFIDAEWAAKLDHPVPVFEIEAEE